MKTRLNPFSERAVLIAGQCEAMSLMQADIALDDARRYIWLKQFSGASEDALRRELGDVREALAKGLEIAGTLDGMPPMEAEEVILEARIYLWMTAFARVPSSMFAMQLQAHNELANTDRPVN